jgi:hypothetical protein
MAAAGLGTFQPDYFANHFDRFVPGQPVKAQTLAVSDTACSLCEQEPDCS